jgi:hypothetical protein
MKSGKLHRVCYWRYAAASSVLLLRYVAWYSSLMTSFKRYTSSGVVCCALIGRFLPFVPYYRSPGNPLSARAFARKYFNNACLNRSICLVFVYGLSPRVGFVNSALEITYKSIIKSTMKQQTSAYVCIGALFVDWFTASRSSKVCIIAR